METFEIHITGDETINSELDSMGIKNIIVELLTPSQDLYRTEYMSSFICKCESYQKCKDYVDHIISKLKSPIIRVKIESPYYEHYKCLYLESHFKPFDNKFPMSRNKKSGKLMGTDRSYTPENYPQFIEKWKDEDVEMCLFDSFVEEDFDWFELYN